MTASFVSTLCLLVFIAANVVQCHSTNGVDDKRPDQQESESLSTEADANTPATRRNLRPGLIDRSSGFFGSEDNSYGYYGSKGSKCGSKGSKGYAYDDDYYYGGGSKGGKAYAYDDDYYYGSKGGKGFGYFYGSKGGKAYGYDDDYYYGAKGSKGYGYDDDNYYGSKASKIGISKGSKGYGYGGYAYYEYGMKGSKSTKDFPECKAGKGSKGSKGSKGIGFISDDYEFVPPPPVDLTPPVETEEPEEIKASNDPFVRRKTQDVLEAQFELEDIVSSNNPVEAPVLTVSEVAPVSYEETAPTFSYSEDDSSVDYVAVCRLVCPEPAFSSDFILSSDNDDGYDDDEGCSSEDDGTYDMSECCCDYSWTDSPSYVPSGLPTIAPTGIPSYAPSKIPSDTPSEIPSALPTPCETISDYICSTSGYETMCEAITEANLLTVFDIQQSSFTMFLPTNAAFEIVEVDLGSLSSEDFVNTLVYHAVPGAMSSTEIVCGSSYEMFNGLFTQTLCSGEGIEDGDVFQVGDGNMEESLPKIIESDIEVCNGIIHVVDNVILLTLSSPPTTAPSTSSSPSVGFVDTSQPLAQGLRPRSNDEP